MTHRIPLTVIAASLLLTACATAPPRSTRSEFEDIPVPKGLAYQQDESTVIETPKIKAGGHVDRGRPGERQPEPRDPEHARGQRVAPREQHSGVQARDDPGVREGRRLPAGVAVGGA